MVSAHGVDAELPARYALPRSDIRFSYWLKSGSTTDDGGEGVLGDLDTSTGQGWLACDVSCAIRLADRYHVDNLHIVKVAQGATSLASDWVKGGTLMTRLHDYVSAIIPSNEDWQIIGIVRQQGEQDSNILSDAQSFEVNLKDHYQTLRTLFSNGYKSLPIIEGEIKKSPNGVATTDTINRTRYAQISVTNDDPYARLATSSDLPQKVDNVHFTTAGLVTLGERMADELARFI